MEDRGLCKAGRAPSTELEPRKLAVASQLGTVETVRGDLTPEPSLYRKSNGFPVIAFFVLSGLLSTLTMDAVALVLVKSGLLRLGQYQIVPRLLGRWVGSFPALVHASILETAPLPKEAVLGVVSHYLIGLSLSSALMIVPLGVLGRRITLAQGLLYGISTCVFPWFIMFPAMGFGFLALKTEIAGTLVGFSVINHLAFGAGIFFWSNALWRPLASGGSRS